MSPFDKLRPPRPPIELRARVLGAALAAPAESRHWIDRLWESRRFRVALAVAFGLSLTAQWLIRDHPIVHDRRPEIVEIEGFRVQLDRLETNAPLPTDLAQ